MAQTKGIGDAPAILSAIAHSPSIINLTTPQIAIPRANAMRSAFRSLGSLFYRSDLSPCNMKRGESGSGGGGGGARMCVAHGRPRRASKASRLSGTSSIRKGTSRRVVAGLVPPLAAGAPPMLSAAARRSLRIASFAASRRSTSATRRRWEQGTMTEK